MRILVDTSVWSAALRRGKNSNAPQAAELRSLIADHRVEIIGPIRQELLSGIREAAQFKNLEKHLAFALHECELDPVLKFTHVAWPIIGHDQIHRLG